MAAYQPKNHQVAVAAMVALSKSNLVQREFQSWVPVVHLSLVMPQKQHQLLRALHHATSQEQLEEHDSAHQCRRVLVLTVLRVVATVRPQALVPKQALPQERLALETQSSPKTVELLAPLQPLVLTAVQ